MSDGMPTFLDYKGVKAILDTARVVKNIKTVVKK